MNLEKVIFGFFIVLAATLNFGFFTGDIDVPHQHDIYELFAAIVVNFIATVLKFGDRTQIGAVHLATSLVADLLGLPSVRADAAYARLLELKPASYVALLTCRPSRRDRRIRSPRTRSAYARGLIPCVREKVRWRWAGLTPSSEASRASGMLVPPLASMTARARSASVASLRSGRQRRQGRNPPCSASRGAAKNSTRSRRGRRDGQLGRQ